MSRVAQSERQIEVVVAGNRHFGDRDPGLLERAHVTFLRIFLRFA
jgi:hypothetical protein